MVHIQDIQTVPTILFSHVDHDTSIEVAKSMRDEIVTFFKEHPKGKLELDFGGYARLSEKFARELFQGEDMKNNFKRIATRHIHVFDQIVISEILQACK